MKTDKSVRRRIDEIGRVLIPSEMRKKFDLSEGTVVDITPAEDGSIIISKATPCCTFCGREDGLIALRSKYVCRECLSEACVLNK